MFKKVGFVFLLWDLMEAVGLLVNFHTIIFLVRGSVLRVGYIDFVLDDFIEERLESGYFFSDYESELLNKMRVDSSLFERVVNEALSGELGYLVSLYSLPYIEKKVS